MVWGSVQISLHLGGVMLWRQKLSSALLSTLALFPHGQSVEDKVEKIMLLNIYCLHSIKRGVGEGGGGSTPSFRILKIGGNYFFIFADKNSSEISRFQISLPHSQHTFSNIGHQRLKSSPRHGITFMRSPFLKPFISYYIKIISYDHFF